ncbi:ketopantoate reductase family protein [Janibacter corallicola]|uniref:ketopantoate reductase family protein n=1 Tax=Janibacter corallicola TaxID=415212 RepID=UPI00082F169D|nr:2-dehydropantoate 2-reductase [Janibacter corallicola]
MADSPITTVAILGAGAMGAMYAQHFVEGGLQTSLVASGERADRLRDTGLTVGGTPLRAPVLDPDRDEAHPVDLVVVAVKHHDLAGALEDVAPFVGPGTTFLSVLNGLDSETTIGERFDPNRVLLCIALGMAAGREGSEITYSSPGELVIGTAAHLAAPERLHRVQTALDRAGLAWSSPADMEHEMWWKFMVNTCINQASAVMRKPYAAFTVDGPARSLMLALREEVIAVSAPEGVPLGDADRERWDTVLGGLPGEGHTSMLQDVLAGRATEVALFAGRVVELGRRHGIPTPYNQTIAWLLAEA